MDGHIVTVRQAGSHLLLRVSVALDPDQGEIVERLLETASMQEKVCGLALAEVSRYVSAGSGRDTLEDECRRMWVKLDRVLDIPS